MLLGERGGGGRDGEKERVRKKERERKRGKKRERKREEGKERERERVLDESKTLNNHHTLTHSCALGT